MTAVADVLVLLASVAPRVSVTTLALLGAACLAWLAWCDREGAR